MKQSERADNLPAVGGLSRFFELFVALRIMRARRRSFFSVVAIISMLGVILGVTALTVILSVSGGFHSAIRDKVLGFHPHIVAMRRGGNFVEYRETADLIRKVEYVKGVSPATYDEMMVAHGDYRAGVVVKGVEVDTVEQVCDLSSFMAPPATLADLRDEPTLERQHDGSIVVSSLVSQSVTTVVALPDGEAVAFEDFVPLPHPDSIALRLINTIPKGSALLLAPEGPNPVDTRPVDYRFASPYVELLWQDDIQLFLRPKAGGSPLAHINVAFEPGKSYTVLAYAQESDAFALRVVSDESTKPEAGLASTRLLNARNEPAVVRFRGEEEEVERTILPHSASSYVELPGRLPAILIAAELAKRIHTSPGSEVTLVTPLRGLAGHDTSVFGMAPTASRFRVAGTFHVGYYEYDTRFVIVSFASARRFLNRGDVPRWLEVRLEDSFMVERDRELVKAAVDPYDMGNFFGHLSGMTDRIRETAAGRAGFEMTPPRDTLDLLRNHAQIQQSLRFYDPSQGYRERFNLIDWQETYRYLFTSLKLQKVVLSIFFLIIVLVASFNIVGSQAMVVHEKLRAIAILRSMGATRRSIRRIFLIQGMIIGTLGTVLGLVLGWLTCLGVSGLGFKLDPKVYYISELPVQMDAWEFAITGLAALLFSFFASQYSAHKAALKTPVEGLRRLD